MPITSVEKDLDTLTMTVIADFSVPVRRLWDAYVDPRQIEKFWGPREWPATFVRHDVFPGGRSWYYMTGPNGEKSSGYWEFLSVTEGEHFEVLDGFATDDGTPNTEMPAMRMTFHFESRNDGSRLTTTTFFNSLANLEQLLEMGMEEGMRSAMRQIDDVVADLRSFAAGIGTDLQILNDTQVRVSRVIRGSVEQVWRAHHDPDLLRQWLLGPDGWRMSGCQVADAVGDTYRYAWETTAGEQGFAFTGELLVSEPPYREVTTEMMEGIPGKPSINEQTLTPLDDGTLLSLVITYPDLQTRDAVIATGMTDGMEASYARLEREVLTATQT